jgi:8-oxo-dGTP pyrophosphatase MutT (NUDIX family)
MAGKSVRPGPAPGETGRLAQYAALVWRPSASSGIEVLLITSRETRRWVLPKGWPIKGLRPHQTAAREAWEEAGVEGRTGARKIGVFDYDKRLTGGALQPVRVKVYPLRVEIEHGEWPESAQRERIWLAPEDAAGRVDEPGLSRLLAGFAKAAS